MNCPACNNQLKSYRIQDTNSILCRVCYVKKELCPHCTWKGDVDEESETITCPRCKVTMYVEEFTEHFCDDEPMIEETEP